MLGAMHPAAEGRRTHPQRKDAPTGGTHDSRSPPVSTKRVWAQRPPLPLQRQTRGTVCKPLSARPTLCLPSSRTPHFPPVFVLSAPLLPACPPRAPLRLLLLASPPRPSPHPRTRPSTPKICRMQITVLLPSFHLVQYTSGGHRTRGGAVCAPPARPPAHPPGGCSYSRHAPRGCTPVAAGRDGPDCHPPPPAAMAVSGSLSACRCRPQMDGCTASCPHRAATPFSSSHLPLPPPPPRGPLPARNARLTKRRPQVEGGGRL